MLEQSSESSEVILFFEEKNIAKEMMFTEFEAILDGVVGLEDFAGESMAAAFVVVNLQLIPTSICLFHIEFDEFGEAPKNWNIPFRSLLDSAALGADLGAGPVQLASRSQCPTGWYTDSLWDPDSETMELIMQSVKRNRLCLPTAPAQDQPNQSNSPGQFANNQMPQHHQAAPPNMGYPYYQPPPFYGQQQTAPQHFNQQQPPPGHPWQYPYPPIYPQPPAPQGEFPGQPGVAQQQPFQQELTDVPELTEVFTEEDKQEEMDALVHEVEEKHKEKIMQLMAKQKQQLAKVHDQAHSIVGKYKRLLSEERKLKTESNDNMAMLTAQIELLKEQTKDQKNRIEDLTAKLESQQNQGSNEKDKVDKELNAAQDTIKHLREELTVLRRDSRRLAENGTDDFFDKLESSGLSFIAFHPGAGHVSVSITNMSEYLENPEAFAARKCNISLEAYRFWLKHYEKPECLAKLDGDRICGAHVKRINHPNDFKAGTSDRCDKHRTGFSASSSVGNYGGFGKN